MCLRAVEEIREAFESVVEITTELNENLAKSSADPTHVIEHPEFAVFDFARKAVRRVRSRLSASADTYNKALYAEIMKDQAKRSNRNEEKLKKGLSLLDRDALEDVAGRYLVLASKIKEAVDGDDETLAHIVEVEKKADERVKKLVQFADGAPFAYGMTSGQTEGDDSSDDCPPPSKKAKNV